MGWDVREEMPHAPGNNVAVFLGGDDSLVDQFGITWMVNITQQQS